MTQKQALAVKDLVKSTIDAIQTIAKVVEKCPECDGTGVLPKVDPKKPKDIVITCWSCEICNGTGRVRWKWEPKARKYCLWGQAVLLITGVNDYRLSVSGVEIIEEVNVNQVTPILEWQEIKRILEGMGCIVKVRDQKDFGKECRYNCGIYTDELGMGMSAPTRQRAMMLSVIEFGKELKRLAQLP